MERISYRETWAEISLDAIAHNSRLFKEMIPPDCRLMAVVKADGYGHGMVEVAKAALQTGADYLGVAFLDEAIRLRQAGVEAPILTLGHTPAYAFDAAVRNAVSVTIHSADGMEDLITCAEEMKRTARVHLKIDTGMSRIGVASPGCALELARKAQCSPYVELEGVFTHFASADSVDDHYTRRQFAAFLAAVEHIEQELGIRIPLRHCCNSAAAARFPEMRMDMVRIGISLYGLSPFGRAGWPDFSLTPAMQFKTRIASVKTVLSGQPIGYDCTYVPDRPAVIATIPVGYADGLPRSLSNNGIVLIRGQRVPIVGRICMDQAMVDASRIPGITPGEEVTLFGISGGTVLPVDDWAERTGTIHYENVCLVGKRVPRLYLREGRIESGQNAIIGRSVEDSSAAGCI